MTPRTLATGTPAIYPHMVLTGEKHNSGHGLPLDMWGRR